MLSAPIEGSAKTAMIGAAENRPGADATPESLVGTRITIGMTSSRPPEPSTQEGAATESALALFARDTEVVLVKIHAVDDPRDSGAGELRTPCAPESFSTPGIRVWIPCHRGGLATE
jgi:hypothetical protein